eukprot:5561222-Pleurochrysis_carterae.AAC.1
MAVAAMAAAMAAAAATAAAAVTASATAATAASRAWASRSQTAPSPENDGAEGMRGIRIDFAVRNTGVAPMEALFRTLKNVSEAALEYGQH